jgi:hypothetical protein
MGEPGAANQTVEREGFKDIGHGRCVGTGASQAGRSPRSVAESDPKPPIRHMG